MVGMSHFLVAVLHRSDQTVEEMLAPYNAELETEIELEYTREEAIKAAREDYAWNEDKTDEECIKFFAEMPCKITDKAGNVYAKYNPKAKWDWYVIGGRFEDSLRVKGERRDSARVGEIDFSPDPEEYEKSLRFWDVVVDHKPAEAGEEHFSIYNEKYYVDTYGDRETFGRVSSLFKTHAVITPDGEWHERGEVGCFGLSSETPEEGLEWDKQYVDRFIKNANPELILTIVDCHI